MFFLSQAKTLSADSLGKSPISGALKVFFQVENDLSLFLIW